MRAPYRAQSPLLFNVFLDMDQRVDLTRPSLAFAADLCVRVPEYQVGGILFLKNHFEGGYLFRDMLIVEATAKEDQPGDWSIKYQFASKSGDPMIEANITANTETRSPSRSRSSSRNRLGSRRASESLQPSGTIGRNSPKDLSMNNIYIDRS